MDKDLEDGQQIAQEKKNEPEAPSKGKRDWGGIFSGSLGGIIGSNFGSNFGPIGAVVGAVAGSYLGSMAIEKLKSEKVEVIDFRAEENVERISTAPILENFEATPYAPNLFLIDVVGDAEFYPQWKKFGLSLVQYLKAHGKSATLISTRHLEHYLTMEIEGPATPFTSFAHNGLTFYITKIEPSNLEKYIPDICESEEFANGYNCWLCLSDQSDSNDVVRLERQMKNFISYRGPREDLKLTIELLSSVSDGFELFWLNP